MKLFKSKTWSQKRRGGVMLCLALVSSLLLFSSCFLDRFLNFNEGDKATIEIKFDWSETKGQPPRRMSVWFYPIGKEGEITRVNIDNPTAPYKAKLKFGEYKAVCVNNDPANLIYSNEKDYDNFTVTAGFITVPSTTKGGMQAATQRGTRGEIDMNTLDGIWTGLSDGGEYVLEKSNYQIVFKPQSKTWQFNIELKVPERIEELESMTGYLKSKISGVIPAQDKLIEEDGEILFKCNIDRATSTIKAKIFLIKGNTSSSRAETENPTKLELRCKMTNGAIYTYVFDISRELSENDGASQIDLKMEKFELPRLSDSNFNILDWDKINIIF